MPSILASRRELPWLLEDIQRTYIKVATLGKDSYISLFSYLKIPSASQYRYYNINLQVHCQSRSRRAALRRSLPMEQTGLPSSHSSQPRLLPRLYPRHLHRNLRLHNPHLHKPNLVHPHLRRRLPLHRPELHPNQRIPLRAILPLKRHPPLRLRPNLVLRRLPHRNSPPQRPSPRPMGCRIRHHHSRNLFPILRPRHLHHPHCHRPLASLPHHDHRNRHLQRRRSDRLWRKRLRRRLGG